MYLVPIFGLGINLGLYFYMKLVIYRKTVEEIELSFPGTYVDIEPHIQTEAYSRFHNHLPVYLKENNVKPFVDQVNFTE